MLDQIFNSKSLTFIFFGLAVITIAVFILGYIPETTAIPILGLLGFSGFAAVRDWLNSQGWKTYAVVGIAVIGVIPYAIGWVTVEQLQLWFEVWGVLGVGTLAHGTVKAQATGIIFKSQEFKKAA